MIKHFHHLQILVNEKEKQVLKQGLVKCYAGHGKEKVDYTGGMAKIFINIAVSNDYFFDKSSETIYWNLLKLKWLICLINLLGKHIHLLKLILKLWQFDETVVRSEDFQTVLFTPGSETLKSSPRLCLCDLCVLNYVLVNFSKKYPVIVKQLKPTLLRLQMLKILDQNDNIQKNNNDFVVPGTIFATHA